MNLKHNKKRNTAFLFEALCKELTKAVVDKNSEYKNKIIKVVKEAFSSQSTLKKELDIYKSVLESGNPSARQAEKIYDEAATQYGDLDKEKIFNEQSDLISAINKSLSSEIFNNFIPSYTAMATAHQLFNVNLNPKKRVILRERMLSSMIAPVLSEGQDFRKVPADKLAHKLYVEKFNETFKDSLLENQKALLSKFINSFADNGLELKIFLNEEITSIRGVIEENKGDDSKMESVLETIDGFRGQWITTDLLKKVLKLQQLAEELQHNGD